MEIVKITFIPDEVFNNMQGKTFFENPYISREDLRYLSVLHYGFDGKVHQGELIVNQKIAKDIAVIMDQLYQKRYPIEKMHLMDRYQGDDNLAMEDNNSSAFNYRLIAGTNRLSKHALGLAIDINPMYNPYIRPDENGTILIEPVGSEIFADRTKDFLYKIDEKDYCYQCMKCRGFTWGGDWNRVKDYQHFQKEIS